LVTRHILDYLFADRKPLTLICSESLFADLDREVDVLRLRGEEVPRLLPQLQHHVAIASTPGMSARTFGIRLNDVPVFVGSIEESAPSGYSLQARLGTQPLDDPIFIPQFRSLRDTLNESVELVYRRNDQVATSCREFDRFCNGIYEHIPRYLARVVPIEIVIGKGLLRGSPVYPNVRLEERTEGFRLSLSIHNNGLAPPCRVVFDRLAYLKSIPGRIFSPRQPRESDHSFKIRLGAKIVGEWHVSPFLVFAFHPHDPDVILDYGRRDTVFRTQGYWIEPAGIPDARAKGFTVQDFTTIVGLHLSESASRLGIIPITHLEREFK